jgi:hypothetical protein
MGLEAASVARRMAPAKIAATRHPDYQQGDAYEGCSARDEYQPQRRPARGCRLAARRRSTRWCRRSLNPPSQRKSAVRADGGAQLVPAEPVALARRDGGAMALGGVRLAVGLALRSVLAQVALPVCVRGQV